MNKHGKQKINGNDLKNEETINELFRNWMNFSEWHTARLDEWIDMVSLSTPENSAIPRFRAQTPEEFVIELQDIDPERQQHQLTILMRQIAAINKRYRERTGRSIISVTIS